MKRSTRIQYLIFYKACRCVGHLPAKWLYGGLGSLIFFCALSGGTLSVAGGA